MRVARFILLALLICVAVAFFESVSLAQLPPAGDMTSPPTPGVGHDYIHAPAETVNPANGSVSVRIPLRVPSGRELTIPLSIAYDSAGAFYYGQTGNNTPHWATITNAVFAQGGWSYTLPILTHSQIVWIAQASNGKNVTCTGAENYVFQDPTGNRHNLGLAVNTSRSFLFPTCDGTGNSILQGGEGPILATATQTGLPPPSREFRGTSSMLAVAHVRVGPR